MAQVSDADKQTLISWIHRLDRKKRTYAIITEQFFERKLASKLIAGPVSYGWAYWADRRDNRLWLKLNWSDSDVSEAESSLIKTLAPNGHKFFVIENFPVVLVQNDGFPEVSVTVKELRVDEGIIKSATSTRGLAVSHAVNEHLRDLRISGEETGACIKAWLNSLSPAHIERVFLSRCILNSYRPEGYPFGPVDIDAMYLSRANRRLEFLEFKRKDAAWGMRCLYDNDTYEQLLETALRYNWKPEEEVKSFLSGNLWPRKGYCFGLDSDSHAANVGFCKQHSIRYRYVIWDQSPTIPLSDLLTEEFEPRASIRLRHALVQPTDFLGMYYSPPWETSAIGQGNVDEGRVRTQLMVDATYLFTEWRLSPQLELTRIAPPIFTC